MEDIAILKQYDIAEKKKIAKYLAGISTSEHSPAR